MSAHVVQMENIDSSSNKINGMSFDTNHNLQRQNEHGTQLVGRQIAKDLIAYRLSQEESPITQVGVCQTMRRLSTELHRHNSVFFNTVCDDIPLEEETFKEISRDTMTGGFNWGRLVSIFTLGGEVAKVMKETEHERADDVEEWLAACVAENERNIEENGGWEEFERHFYQPKVNTYVFMATGAILVAIGISLFVNKR